jgi:hypothetical protein
VSLLKLSSTSLALMTTQEGIFEMLWTACIAQENEPEGLFSEEYGLYTQESSHTVRSHDS